MKTRHTIPTVLWTLILVLSSLCYSPRIQAQPVSGGPSSITYQTFYDELSPYGTWIDYPSYGHVWHPSVAGTFRPYLTNGYWDYSNEGWLWTSGYSWGWAPLMPNVYVGIQFGAWRPPAFYWNACPRGRIYDRSVFNFVAGRDIVSNNINRITIINNFSNTRVHNQFYAKGPDVREVEKFTSRKIQPMTIHEVNRAADVKQEGNTSHIFRPNIEHPQPREFRRLNDDHFEQPHPDAHNDMMEGNQQQQNISRLPVHRAPAGAIGGAERRGRGR